MTVAAAAAAVGTICSADDPCLVSTNHDARGVGPRGQVYSAIQDLDGHAVENSRCIRSRELAVSLYLALRHVCVLCAVQVRDLSCLGPSPTWK